MTRRSRKAVSSLPLVADTELLRSVPEGEQQASEFTPEWTAELRRRLVEMSAVEARGEPAGIAMSIDDLIEHVRATADTDE